MHGTWSHPRNPLSGFLVPWIVQPLPFQRSARVTLSPKVGSMYDPTAVQTEIDVHEIPPSSLDVVLCGTGTLRIDQAVPFHASASATGVLVLVGMA
jgi:hypothetical protein